MKTGLNQKKIQIMQMKTLNLNSTLMTMKVRIYSQILRKQSLLKMLYLQRQFQMRKRILKFKDKVLSQFCQKMRNSHQFASVIHQGKTFKMLGEIAPVWRPKTRPINKLRLNMKRLLNPKLNKERVTVIDYSSSMEKLNDDKYDSKGKKKI